ncbi:hypothetical protein ANCDUO_04253 [Ancylostoma duodenale]|uniref:DNA repair metallo-beta-lactamase domain-containing protein n=1 Tax=Ancylostoma duodenale TaxID=51022 RepID=A0A0C2DRQ5_9BILA|nr:hypothetical protein ANCDUO_04253 [Ancylostoma duodenale]
MPLFETLRECPGINLHWKYGEIEKNEEENIYSADQFVKPMVRYGSGRKSTLNCEPQVPTPPSLERKTLSKVAPPSSAAVRETVSAPNTPRGSSSRPRNVRFCNESSNEVRIIPAVKTTLPFAEQMAKERQAEAEEVQRLQFVEARSDNCKYHFLTHAHVDHIGNLNKSWKSPIYCSELTAKILPVVMGKRAPSSTFVRPLKVGESHMIEPNLLVTVLDAHHCLGSVMFLFEGASIPGGSVLCTGDFRADSEMLARFENDPSFMKLAETSISKIYIDNTYLEHREATFPERGESAKMLLSEMDKLHYCSVLFPVFKLGREEMLEKVSEHLSEPISTSSQRLAIRKVCGLKRGEFCDEMDATARIRTSLRGAKNVFAALKKMPDPAVVIDISLRGEYSEVLKENLVAIPYSDHSSREEIFAFLSRLQFGEVVPISAPMELSTAEELMKLSQAVIPPTTSYTSADDVQTIMEKRPVELGQTEEIAPTSPGLTSPRLKFNFSSLRSADKGIFQSQGVDLLQFCCLADSQKFVLDPPRSGQLKMNFYDVHGNVLG